MAENDAGERSEKATPRKLQKARDKGQVARSRELTTAILLIASPLALLFSTGAISEGFIKMSEVTLSVRKDFLFDERYMMWAFAESLYVVFSSLLVFFGVVFVASVLSPVALGGISFSVEAMQPKGNRLSPLAGFKRMFGMNAAVELGKAIGKFLLVALVAWLVISTSFDTYMSLGKSTPSAEVKNAIELILIGLLMVSISLILIALIDVPYQIWNHAKQLKMTKQELKDEFKETEGKPEVKGRIRQLQREVAHRRMMEAIPDADVVVTNPEHYSVALKYDQLKLGAPIVVAKGVDEVAMNIRKVANAHEVPLVAAPPLARSLFHTTKLNQEIPAGLYLAVAQILAYVMQLKAYKKGKSIRPKPITNYPIPDELKH